VIDLHSHILPGVDDGAKSLEDSLAMARMAVSDGIQVMACTPHFMPGVYDNTAQDIQKRIASLSEHLVTHDIPLALVAGADAHIRPDFLQCLKRGEILTLHGSRYVLVEPPHDLKPKRLDDLLFSLTVAGYVPILTHPERLRWIETGYPLIQQMFKSGVWMQVTAGSVSGGFGARAQYWAQRMLAEGMVHILATDCHNTRSRPPLLAEAADLAGRALGNDEAVNLVLTRPVSVVEDADPNHVPPPPGQGSSVPREASLFSRIFEVFR
jgi:protein-tyrosine phosphatase